MSRDEIPRGVFVKDGRYYLVVAEGKKRKWHGLSRVKDGIVALYAALSAKKRQLQQEPVAGRLMPALIAEWEAEVMPAHAPATQTLDRHYDRGIAEALRAWTPEQLDARAWADFLRQFRDRPRTFNAYRSQARELMRFAEEKGRRAAGTNPLEAIKTMRTRARTRCPTTSEIRRVKIGCLYGEDGKRTPSGMMMACVLELLYLTGQDVSVVVRILDARDPQQPDEPHVRSDGIYFRRDKTGADVVIEWTPRLRAVIDRLRALKAERMLKRRAEQRIATPRLLTKVDGTPLSYEAVSNAWNKGLKRSGVLHFMLRDIRAAAMTDKEASEGMRAASAMGAHATESQTADYVRRKRARKTGATR